MPDIMQETYMCLKLSYDFNPSLPLNSMLKQLFLHLIYPFWFLNVQRKLWGLYIMLVQFQLSSLPQIPWRMQTLRITNQA